MLEGKRGGVVRLVAAAGKLTGLMVLLVIACGAAFERVAAWRDARVLAQVGQSVDVGGRTLNIHCIGEGSPTVVFESGRIAPGYVWTPTQRGVAAFTRACWRDRAGVGWSDPGPDPSWGDSAARDLHQLLENAHIAPPYVMVGASFGGYVIRLYNAAYPGEVAGMVFADAAQEDAGTIEGIPHKERPPLPRWVIRSLSIGLGQLGMMRMLSRDSGPPPEHWSAEEWDVLTRLRRQRKVLLADAQVGPEKATADLVRGTGGLEDMPMIVLSQGRMPADPAAVLEGWIGLQQRLAQRSRRGRLVVVNDSGHGIPVEAPDAVIEAVKEIVMEVLSSPTTPSTPPP
jgi:pimeloyl-ACP methyl ester carboxylesterase